MKRNVSLYYEVPIAELLLELEWNLFYIDYRTRQAIVSWFFEHGCSTEDIAYTLVLTTKQVVGILRLHLHGYQGLKDPYEEIEEIEETNEPTQN